MNSGTPSVLPIPAWERLCTGLDKGTVLVIGKPGLGKTCLVRYFAEQLAAQGRMVGVLCTDMGQASVGVPTCLGLSLTPPWREPAASWFIGDTTPVGNLLQTVVGTVRLVEYSRQQQVPILLIDTSGLVDGSLGRVLKYHKAVAIRADHLVAIQRDAELEPLLALLQGVCRTIHRLAPAAEACDRSPSERKHYRETRLQAHFREGVTLEFRPNQLLSLDWMPGPSAERSRPLPGTVVGLLDRQGFCLGLGLLEEIRPDRLPVFTSWRDPEAVSWVQIGKVRLTPWGEELSR
jgi:polynucleotide 5'-hydroxyl-kinase GRC3/NOL9